MLRKYLILFSLVALFALSACSQTTADVAETATVAEEATIEQVDETAAVAEIASAEIPNYDATLDPATESLAWTALNITSTDPSLDDHYVGMSWISYGVAPADLDATAVLTPWFGADYANAIVAEQGTISCYGNISATCDIYYIVPRYYGTRVQIVMGDTVIATNQPFFFYADGQAQLAISYPTDGALVDATPITSDMGVTTLAAEVENLAYHIYVADASTPADYLPPNVVALAGGDGDLAQTYCEDAFNAAASQISAMFEVENQPSMLLGVEYYQFDDTHIGFEISAYWGDVVQNYRVCASLAETVVDGISPVVPISVTAVDNTVPTYSDIAIARAIAKATVDTTALNDAASITDTTEFWMAITLAAQLDVPAVDGAIMLTTAQLQLYSSMLYGTTELPVLEVTPTAEVAEDEEIVPITTVQMNEEDTYFLPVITNTVSCDAEPAITDFDFPLGQITLEVILSDGTVYYVDMVRHQDSLNSFAVSTVRALVITE